MRLTNGMLLFHGSYTSVETVDLSLSSMGKDFGKGFYLTSDPNQAKNFIRTVVDRAQQRGIVSFADLEQKIVDLAGADIIIGKVANDKTNPVITAYLNGLYGNVMSDEAVEEAIRRLLPDHLVDQYCFLTQRAIGCLEFQEAKKYVIS